MMFLPAKRRYILLGILAIVVGILASYPYRMQTPTMQVGSATFTLQVARTEAELESGLAGVPMLQNDQAMLFDFARDDKWGIWMKGMSYPIDIIWLNKDKQVIHVATNAQPSSYPGTIFTPPTAARYVLETRAGVANAKRITIGAYATFDSTKGAYK